MWFNRAKVRDNSATKVNSSHDESTEVYSPVPHVKIGNKFDSRRPLAETLTLSQTSPCFYMSTGQSFKNTLGIGEIARKDAPISPSQQRFLPFCSTFCHFPQNQICCPQTLAVFVRGLEKSNICRLEKGSYVV